MTLTDHQRFPWRAAGPAFFMLCGALMCGWLMAANPNLGSDSLGYLLPMHNLAAGQGYVMYAGEGAHLHYPPLYGFLSYLVFLLVGDVALSGMLVSGLAYVGCIFLAWRCAELVFGPRAACLAGFLAAFYPALLATSYVTLSEALFSFCLLAGLQALNRLTLAGGGMAWAVAAGAACGCAYLTRPEGFLPGLLLPASLLLLGRAGRAPEPAPRPWFLRNLPLACAALAAFLALAGPYVFYLRANLGVWTISGKTAEVFLRAGGSVTRGGQEYLDSSQAPQASEGVLDKIVSSDPRQGRELLLRVRYNLAATRQLLFKYLLPGLVPLLLFWLLLPLRDPARLAPWPRPPHLGRAGLNLLVFLSPLPVLQFFLILDRYLAPYGLLLFLALAGLISLTLERHNLARPALGLAGAMLAALLMLSQPGVRLLANLRDTLPNPPDTMSAALSLRHANNGVLRAGQWLRSQMPNPPGPIPVYVSRKAYVLAFFANGQRLEGPFIPLDIGPDLSLESIGQSLAQGRARLLVLDNHYTQRRPALLPLWRDPSLAARHGLELLRQDPRGEFMVFAPAPAAPARP